MLCLIDATKIQHPDFPLIRFCAFRAFLCDKHRNHVIWTRISRITRIYFSTRISRISRILPSALRTRDFWTRITRITRIFFSTRISRISRILPSALRTRDFWTRDFFEHESHESHEYIFSTRISRISRIFAFGTLNTRFFLNTRFAEGPLTVEK